MKYLVGIVDINGNHVKGMVLIIVHDVVDNIERKIKKKRMLPKRMGCTPPK